MLEDSAQYMRGRFLAATAGADDLLRRLPRASCAASRATRTAAELHRLRYLAVTLTDEPEIRASLTAMVAQWQAGVRAAVEAARASGRIRADIPVDSVAMLFFGLAQAAGFMSAVEGEGALACFPRHFDALVELLTPIQGGTG